MHTRSRVTLGTPRILRAAPRRNVGLVGAALLFPLFLGGCALLPGGAQAGSTPYNIENTDQPETAQPVAEFFPEGSAEQNEPYFSSTLRNFAVTEAPVQGVSVVDALAAAGFDKSQMQVTFDQSRTGLVADSILASVQIGTDCLIGQVVTADRSVTTTIAPALTDAQNVCLIGNTRVIDW